mgnify:CR=1 FL=1
MAKRMGQEFHGIALDKLSVKGYENCDVELVRPALMGRIAVKRALCWTEL